MRRLILLALLSLIAWLLPTPIQAKQPEVPLVFSTKLDNKPQVIYGPQSSEIRKEIKTAAPKRVVQKPKPRPQPVQEIPTVQVSTPRRDNPQPKKGYNPCSCVSYVKSVTGYSKSVGNARNWPTNSRVPAPGAVVVTFESAAGHVAIVSHSDSQYVYISSEANYSRCKVTYTRKLPLNSPKIKGFWINK